MGQKPTQDFLGCSSQDLIETMDDKNRKAYIQCKPLALGLSKKKQKSALLSFYLYLTSWKLWSIVTVLLLTSNLSRMLFVPKIALVIQLFYQGYSISTVNILKGHHYNSSIVKPEDIFMCNPAL